MKGKIKHLSRLSLIKLEPEERKNLEKDVVKILEYVELIKKAGSGNTDHKDDHSTTDKNLVKLRKDKPEDELCSRQQRLLDAAAKRHKRWISSSIKIFS